MLKITRRDFRFADSMNVRTEMHGEDKVEARDVRLTVKLPRDIADVLIGPGAAEAFWVKRGDGETHPRFAVIQPLKLTDKIEDVSVTIWPLPLVEPNGVAITGASLSRVTLEPLAGGDVELSFLLQCKPDADVKRALDECLHRAAEAEVTCETFRKPKAVPETKQEMLALAESGEPAQDAAA